jgi:hypothetical protein
MHGHLANVEFQALGKGHELLAGHVPEWDVLSHDQLCRIPR